jgi:hypothetical protein
MADQSNGIAFRVVQERHPFIGSGRTESVVGMREDHVRFGNDLGTVGAQRLDAGAYVVDPKIDQRARCPSARSKRVPPSQKKTSPGGLKCAAG